MALRLKDKKAIVSEVADVAKNSISLVLADYRGMSVTQMIRLRSKARETGVYVRVVRNTLAKRALNDTDFECLQDHLVGPTILAFSRNEPSSAARLLRDFGKDNEHLIVKSLSLSGQLYDANQLELIAKLPTKDEAISKLMAVMKAPIEKLVRTMIAPHIKLVRTVVAIRDEKQAS